MTDWLFRRATAALFLLLGGLALGGCQPATQDPARAGFFSGMGNLASGTYDQRLQAKQQELSNSQQVRDELRRRADAAQIERLQSETTLEEWRRRVAAINLEAAQLERQLADAKKRLGGGDPQVVDAANKLRVFHTAQVQAAADPVPSPAERERLARYLRAVRASIAIISRPE